MTDFPPPGRVIVVVRTATAEEAYTAAKGAVDGGVEAVEITMTVPGATTVIERLAAEPALVGAGTVLSRAEAVAAVEAGARFLVAPDTDPEVMAAAWDLGVPVVPGALTPTEIRRAWVGGADAVKVFPARALGGPAYIRDLIGPLPDIPLVISGGVNADTAREYLDLGVAAVCLGREVVPAGALEAGDVAAVAARTREVLAAIREPSR